jgi:hypothetical protein
MTTGDLTTAAAAYAKRIDELLDEADEANGELRVELLRSGVARRMVDSLYPRPASGLTWSIVKLFEAHGDKHMNHDDSPQDAWQAQYNLLRRMKESLPPEVLSSYLADFGVARNAQPSALLHSAVYNRLTILYWLPMAKSLVACYEDGTFMAYWLTQCGGAAHFEPEDVEAVLRWVVEKQLPPVD